MSVSDKNGKSLENVTTYINLEKLRLLYRINTGKSLTQTTLAKILDVPQSTISDWENNVPISLNRVLLAKLKLFFNCSFDDLLEIGESDAEDNINTSPVVLEKEMVHIS